jgi:DNA-directed RNA polymerase specialized sigma24 family protein
MKERIDIIGKTCKEVMLLCNCSRTTAKNALKRGYYVVDYKKRTCIPGPIDVEACYKMAWSVFNRNFRHRCPWNSDAEDLVQEAVLRMLELGGHPRSSEGKFMFHTAFAAMRCYIVKHGRSNDLGDWRTSRQRYNEERNAEARASGTASPNTWQMSQQATEKIVRAIYEMGGGVNQVQLRKRLGYSSGGISKRVYMAIDEGLVRNTNEEGRRSSALNLTAAGRAFIGAPRLAA